MKIRQVTVTLEKAKEWYNSGNDTLKEVALQAFSEKELDTDYKNIRTFRDAVEALGLSWSDVNTTLMLLGSGHLKYVYILDIIKKALNGTWKPSLIKGDMYYPIIKFYPSEKAEKVAEDIKGVTGASFITDGKKFTLVGGMYRICAGEGLCTFYSEYGNTCPNVGLLGCKSKEIAEHMSKYFSKEIFNALYAHYENYNWV